MTKYINELDRQLQLIKRLCDMHIEATSAFTVYETIMELRAPNYVGEKEADKNAKVIANYKYFFNIAVDSLSYNFLMLISMLFINDRKSLSLHKIIDIIERNPTTIKEFIELNKDRTLIDELAVDYIGITAEDLRVLRERLESVKETVSIVKAHRDQIWAHRDIEVIVPDQITFQNIYDLLNVGDEILQILTSQLNRESTSYILIKPETTKQTKSLIGLLRESSD